MGYPENLKKKKKKDLSKFDEVPKRKRNLLDESSVGAKKVRPLN